MAFPATTRVPVRTVLSGLPEGVDAESAYMRIAGVVGQFYGRAAQSHAAGLPASTYKTVQLGGLQLRYTNQFGLETVHVAFPPPPLAPAPSPPPIPAPPEVEEEEEETQPDAILAIDVQFVTPLHVARSVSISGGTSTALTSVHGMLYGVGAIYDPEGAASEAVTCSPFTQTGLIQPVSHLEPPITRSFGYMPVEPSYAAPDFAWNTQNDPGTGESFGSELYAGGGLRAYAPVGSEPVTIDIYVFSHNFRYYDNAEFPLPAPDWVDRMIWRVQAREYAPGVVLRAVSVETVGDLWERAHLNSDFSVTGEVHGDMLDPPSTPTLRWGFAVEDETWTENASRWPADPTRDGMGELLDSLSGDTSGIAGPEVIPPELVWQNPSWNGPVSGMTKIATITWTPPAEIDAVGTATIEPA